MDAKDIVFFAGSETGMEDGEEIAITATTSGAAQLVFEAPAGDDSWSHVWVEASNNDTADHWAKGICNGVERWLLVKAGSWDYLYKGRRLRDGQQIKVYADVASKIGIQVAEDRQVLQAS